MLDHCSGKSNPADTPSHELSSSELAAGNCGNVDSAGCKKFTMLFFCFLIFLKYKLIASNALCLNASADDFIHLSTLFIV